MYWWCSHCASKTYICHNTELENLDPHFWEVCHADVLFQWKKNHLQTTIRWEYHGFSCHPTKPTQEAWKPQFWPADFIFPSMAAALDLCLKLVNLSRKGNLNQFFFYVEICLLKGNQIFRFLENKFTAKKKITVLKKFLSHWVIVFKKKKSLSHWVTVFKKKNVCHTESLCLRKMVKNCQKLSKTVKNDQF